MNPATIAAISTPRGVGAIAIVRISGNNSHEIAKLLIPGLPENSLPWKLYHAFALDPESNNPFDEVLVCTMKTPFSYTGEDMVEIFCHGGHIIPELVLSKLIFLGAIPAKPGEFTQRALNNGKIDLVQAEYIQQMSSVKSQKELELSLKNIQGHLSRKIDALLEEIKSCTIWAEAMLSFPDQIEEEKDLEDLLFSWIRQVDWLLEQYQKSKKLEEGFQVVIAGNTNVGKSSLFNMLVEKDRSLVSPFSSTTHDYIKEQVLWDGQPVTLYDTAGWTSNPNGIDSLCIKQTEAIIKQSSLLLFVEDLSTPSSHNYNLFVKLHKQYPDKIWLILNKVDLNDHIPTLFNNILGSNIPKHIISVLKQQGIVDLKNHILDTLRQSIDNDLVCLVNERWHSALSLVKNILFEIRNLKKPNEYIDMIIPELKQIQLLLSEQIGYNLNQEIYKGIFQRFCIGK